MDWDEVDNDAKGKTESDYHDIVRDKQPLIKGLSKKLMEKILEKEIKRMSKITDGNLTESQRIEWNNIGKQVFSWSCCFRQRC